MLVRLTKLHAVTKFQLRHPVEFGLPDQVAFFTMVRLYFGTWSVSLSLSVRYVFAAQNAPFLQIKNAVFLRIAVNFRKFEVCEKIFAKPLDRTSSA